MATAAIIFYSGPDNWSVMPLSSLNKYTLKLTENQGKIDHMGHFGMGILEGMGMVHPTRKTTNSDRRIKISTAAGLFMVSYFNIMR